MMLVFVMLQQLLTVMFVTKRALGEKWRMDGGRTKMMPKQRRSVCTILVLGIFVIWRSTMRQCCGTSKNDAMLCETFLVQTSGLSLVVLGGVKVSG